MSSKRHIAVSLISLLLLLVLSLVVVSGAMAGQSLRFKIVKHAQRYDLVKGHKHHFRVRHEASSVKVRGLGNLTVVSRTAKVVVMATNSYSTPKPTVTTPNSGDFAQGTSSRVGWKLSTTTSSGYFRVSLQDVATSASTSLAAKVATSSRTRTYSVPWTMSQAAGSYRIVVEYCSSAGTVLSSDTSDGTVNITAAAPAPAPVVTETPTPTPTVTATVTPAPTPTPSTTAGALVLNNAHDITYTNVDFEGRGNGNADASGLITITGATYNITFRNCIIGTNQDGVGNGVKIYDSGAGMHDITFENCTFKYQPRMGFECCSRRNPNEGGTGGQGYLRVNITGCTFAASAGEAISYDDNYSTLKPAGYCTVANNWVDGAGVGNSYAYGRVFENNGVHNMTVTGNYFGAGRDGIMNITGRDSTPLNFVSSGNVIDGSHVPSGVALTNQVFCMVNVKGGATFSDKIINGSGYSSASWGWFTGCTSVDFRASTVTGATATPNSGYVSNCSGMLWPGT